MNDKPKQQQQTDPRTTDDQPTSRIKGVFRSRYRELSALFPDDGETMVNRACASAIMAARGPLKGIAVRNPEGIAEKVIACHHLGLELGDQAYLVPYGNEPQLIIGPRGLIALMFRSGFVKDVEARSVFRADVEAGLFDYDFGEKRITHRKAEKNRRPAKVRVETLITHAYAIVQTTTGGREIEVLTAEDIAFYRSFSKATSGPWFDNYEGMCRKTAIKRVAEFVPRSPLLVAALRESDHGTYEIPEEIMAAVRQKNGASVQVPDDLMPVDREVVYDNVTGEVPAEQRQPGDD